MRSECTDKLNVIVTNIKTLSTALRCFMANLCRRKRRDKLYLCLSAECPKYLSDFNQIWNFSTDFHKVPNTKFHGNPSMVIGADTRT